MKNSVFLVLALCCSGVSFANPQATKAPSKVIDTYSIPDRQVVVAPVDAKFWMIPEGYSPTVVEKLVPPNVKKEQSVECVSQCPKNLR